MIQHFPMGPMVPTQAPNSRRHTYFEGFGFFGS